MKRQLLLFAVVLIAGCKPSPVTWSNLVKTVTNSSTHSTSAYITYYSYDSKGRRILDSAANNKSIYSYTPGLVTCSNYGSADTAISTSTWFLNAQGLVYTMGQSTSFIHFDTLY